MSRPLRLEFAGALYHLTSRGNDRKNIFFEESDFELFISILSDVCISYHCSIHAYCLMSNHYHLLLETSQPNLSKVMRQLNGVFTQKMNQKHHHTGHLFQGRYKAILVDKEPYLLELSRYIVLNPVRAKMVNSPDEWLWSNWHNMIGRKESPPWLTTDFILRYFSSNRAEAIAAYINFVGDGVNKKIWDDLQHQIFLGDDNFVEKHQLMSELLEGDVEEIPTIQRSRINLTLEEYQTKYSKAPTGVRSLILNLN
ncbi:MAG: transposase [Psychromonas sp.]|nr:transposase [Alteromonadales bacterium]MCP5078472.1 transposase [Psychromonas sp.]